MVYTMQPLETTVWYRPLFHHFLVKSFTRIADRPQKRSSAHYCYYLTLGGTSKTVC